MKVLALRRAFTVIFSVGPTTAGRRYFPLTPREAQMADDDVESRDSLIQTVESRLLSDDQLQDDAKYLVFAALHSQTDAEFAEAAAQDGGELIAVARQRLQGGAEVVRPAPAARVFLTSIEGEGFRGIGRRAELRLKPGPGLTVVAGRNGSGKSSFAEAAEVAVTGESHRWTSTRSRSRKWRNIHHKAASRVTLTLAEEGAGDTVVTTDWAPGVTDFAGSSCRVQRHGRPVERDRAALGWRDELTLFKPFLSHTELGDQLEGGRFRLYTAINSVLGLEHLDMTLSHLDVLLASWGAAQKDSDSERRALRTSLAELTDDRAGAVHRLLGKTRPELDRIAEYATGRDDGGRLGLLRSLADLTAPDLAAFEMAVVGYSVTQSRMRVAGEAVDVADARRRDLLRVALERHAEHGPDKCPLCGDGTLDDAWAQSAAAELESGDEAAREADRTRRDHQHAAQQLARFVTAVPGALRAAADDPLPEIVPALDAWRTYATFATAEELASSVGAAALMRLLEEVRTLRSAAEAERSKLQDDWQPHALRIARWLELAGRAETMYERTGHAKAAQSWMRTHADDIRNDRLAPVNDRIQEIWAALKQQSNVSVDPLVLKGARNQRQVVISASVDGESEDSGMDVMSQGELNALALAIFLPRVDLAASPFGFVMIDDPVQAMDPAKVDGLARVLEDLAERRQVIVFTHDDRLPEAIHRLQIAATILTVSRDEKSEVVVHESSDPVSRYLVEAEVIAKDDDIPLDVRRRVVPRLCRDALERRCKELFYRRELRAGAAREDVEQRWGAARETKHRLRLVVNRNGESNLDRWLHQGHRRLALGAAGGAVHHGWDGDLMEAVRSTRRTVVELAADHG